MEGLHRLPDRPAVRLRRRRGRAGHGAWASGTCNCCGALPTASCWCSTATRRADAARSNCWSCSSPSRSTCAILTLPDDLDPCDFLLQPRGRSIPPAGRRSRRCPGARLSRGDPRRWTWHDDTHAVTGRSRSSWPRWPRPRGCRSGTTPRRGCARHRFCSRLARKFGVPEEQVAGPADGAAAADPGGGGTARRANRRRRRDPSSTPGSASCWRSSSRRPAS